MIFKYMWTSISNLRKIKRWEGLNYTRVKRGYIGWFLLGFIPLYVKCIKVGYD